MSLRFKRAGLALLSVLTLSEGALAQYDPAPPAYGYEPPPVRRQGINCQTFTPGNLFAAPTPFFCPLPRRQPLGSVCLCRAPAQYGREDWEGRVVP